MIRRAAVWVALATASVGLGACTHDRIVITSPTPASRVILSRPVALPPASAPLDGRVAAQLRVVSGFDTISVRIADTGDDLFRASTPLGSSGRPMASVVGNEVAITQQGTGGGGPASLDVTLHPLASWRVAIDGGATAATLDLSAGQDVGVDLASGIASISVSLPRPRGTTAIAMTGGANQFRVHLRGAAPVRTTLTGGAGAVTVDGEQRSGVAGGTVLASPGWSAAADRYDVACAAGVAALTIDRAS